uniref:Inhibitor of nuclear factor kappa B kinase subunit epsilon n=1 Tax=Petromyzon marinus TaxID=7757 RepID=S4RFF2_PETMA
MQSTANYLWWTNDVLGQGATGSVYRGRNKKTGDLFAIKTFNQLSYMRPQDVQVREFDVLRRLDHKNIVKLFAIEDENNTKQKVIIMELCSGGSLYTILDEPENAYGLTEGEFLIVLRDVVSGMNHLREKGIIHRDLKPGNIMRVVGEDGRSVYKLTDFGAARQLEDKGQLMSLYGTEESLKVNVYLLNNINSNFPLKREGSSTGGPWSRSGPLRYMALHHLEVHMREIRYKNLFSLYRITAEKPRGAVSGEQKEEGGSIVWNEELPITCQLSRGLKLLLTPLLANIMEVNKQHCWNFDQFFAAANEILTRHVFHIFSLSQLSLFKVYVQIEQQFKSLQELIEKQTGIAAAQQELLFEGRRLHYAGNTQLSQLPTTSEDLPIMLLGPNPMKIIGFMYIKPEVPKFHSQYNLIHDASLAKSVTAELHQVQRISSSLLCVQVLARKGARWILPVTDGLKPETMCKGLFVIVQCNQCNKRMVWSDQMKELDNLNVILLQKMKAVSTTSRMLEQIGGRGVMDDCLEGVHQALLPGKPLTEPPVERMGSTPAERQVERIGVLVDKVLSTYYQFKKDKLQQRLQYNEEQIHKFEKQKLGTYAVAAMTLLTDDCQPKYQAVQRTYDEWLRSMLDVRKSMVVLAAECNNHCKMLDLLLEKLNKMHESYPGAVEPCSITSHQSYVCPATHIASLSMKKLKLNVKEMSEELHKQTVMIQRLGSFSGSVDFDDEEHM